MPRARAVAGSGHHLKNDLGIYAGHSTYTTRLWELLIDAYTYNTYLEYQIGISIPATTLSCRRLETGIELSGPMSGKAQLHYFVLRYLH